MKLLKTFWKHWKRFGKFLATIQMHIFLMVFYFLILWMIGLIVRIVSDPLNLKKDKRLSNYTPWTHPAETIEQANNQY